MDSKNNTKIGLDIGGSLAKLAIMYDSDCTQYSFEGENFGDGK